MCGHSANLWGEALADTCWRDSYRYILLDATPLRTGRGHSKPQTNQKGYRHESKRREDGFSEVRARVAKGLLDGWLDAVAARQRIEEAGFGGFLHDAESRAELVEVYAHFAAMGSVLRTFEGHENSIIPLLR